MLSEQQPAGGFLQPDFVIVPTQLLIAQQAHRLTHLDCILYGYIYWHVKLKGEKCYAGNSRLSALCGVNPRSIKKSLARLEVQGFIKREYAMNEGQVNRSEITPLIQYTSGIYNVQKDTTLMSSGTPKKENFNKSIETPKPPSSSQPAFINEWAKQAKVTPGGFRNTTVYQRGLPMCKKITPEIQEAFDKLVKQGRTQEDFDTALRNYMTDIINRDPKEDYALHRFSLYEFLSQKNGFLKYLNK